MVIASQLADAIVAASEGHTRAFPNGDWRSANDRLGAVRLTAGILWPETIGKGNAETVKFLRAVTE